MPHQCTNCDRTFDDGSKEMLSGCPECGGTKFQFRPDGFGGSDSASDGAADEPPAAGDAGPTAEAPPEPTDRPGDSVTRTVGNAAATVRDLVSGSAGSDATQARPPEDADAASDSVTASTAGASSETDSSPTTGDDDIIVAEEDPTLAEDTAQADARTQLADPEEMPESEGYDPATADKDENDSGDSLELTDPGESTDSPETTAAADPEAASGAAEPTDGEPAAEDRAVADEPDTERADRPDLAELREELNDQFESIRVLEPGQYELNLMELYDREEYIIALQEDGRYSIQVPETWRQADA